MNPTKVAGMLYTKGMWYTYWELTHQYEYRLPRREALWLMWVAWNYQRHHNKLHENCN